MSYMVETRTQPRQPYVAIRETVPMAEIGAAMAPLFGRLYGWLGSHGVVPSGPPYARYLSVGPEEVEFEIAAPIAAEVPADAGLIAGVRPAGEVAWTVHVGPYDELPQAYAAISAWLAGQELGPSGAMWEVYENGPDTEPDPAHWRTLVCFPFMRD